MSLLEQLTSDMKDAMRAKEKTRLTTIRGLMAEIKRAQIDSKKDFTPDEEIAFLTSQAKRRREAIEAYHDVRPELAEKEQEELDLITQYLPKQMSPEEVTARLQEIIAETGAVSKKDMGKVMGRAMSEFKGKFPGNGVKDRVSSLLED